MSNLVFESDTTKRPAFKVPDDLGIMIREALYQSTLGPVSWNIWASIARDLGQECANRCWVYPGPVTDPTPPVDRTPISSKLKVISK